ASVGITSHAAEALGDVVFVDLPEAGDSVPAGQPCGEVESTKSVSDVFSPVTGVVAAVNETLVGAPEHDHPSPQVFNLIMKRRRIAGSLIGGIAETQEMLDFCGQHGITSDIELIPMQQINEAYERMLKSDVKYRFVVDIDSLRA
ncbi:MAG: hypothetical protein LBE87_10950, partial [Serratia marcescens]|nr:hypothetical protein [Serratia marcescens]